MKKKKTTYAIIGLIASGFLILPALILITKATGKPYDPADYYTPVIEVTGDEEEVVAVDTVWDESDLLP